LWRSGRLAIFADTFAGKLIKLKIMILKIDYGAKTERNKQTVSDFHWNLNSSRSTNAYRTLHKKGA